MVSRQGRFRRGVNYTQGMKATSMVFYPKACPGHGTEPRRQKGWHGLCSVVLMLKIRQEEIHTSPWSCFQWCDLHSTSIIRLCAIFHDVTLQQFNRPAMLHWDKLQQEIALKRNFFIISQVCAFTLCRNMLSNLTSCTQCWHICLFGGVASPPSLPSFSATCPAFSY